MRVPSSCTLSCTAIVAALVAFAGCGSPTHPSSLEPALLSQEYRFACGQWSPAEPPPGQTVVDLLTRDPLTDLRPSQQALDAMVAAGGRIVHIYNVPMARAVIDPRRAATLVGNSFTGIARYARTVTDPTQLDVRVIVVLISAVTDEDIAAAQAVGARVGDRWTVIPGYWAVIPDASIPALRALPRVQYVEADGIGCLA